MNISIVIPAYNESSRIAKGLRSIVDYFRDKDLKYEVLVVDDGSTDETTQVLEGIKGMIPALRVLKNRGNKGKGYSVKRGVLESASDLVLFTDADMSAPIEELEKLKRAIGQGADIAIGSRVAKGSNIIRRQNKVRESMGKVFNYFVRAILGLSVRDTQCGFKLFKRDAALDIFSLQKIDGFSFDAELLYIAKRKGYNVKAVPVVWANSPNSKVKMFSSSFNMLMDLFRIKRIHSDI